MHARNLVPLLFAALLMPGPTSVASADVPSGVFSEIDPCMVFCPAGELRFRVVVRTAGGSLVPFPRVALDFSRCRLFAHCPDIPAPLVVDEAARRISLVGDQQGVVNFAIPMSGVCPGDTVLIMAAKRQDTSYVQIGERTLASPDRDGDLSVDAADQAAIQALVGTNDRTADLDCNGVVDATDLAIFAEHQFHACTVLVPTRHQSWGGLKLIYR